MSKVITPEKVLEAQQALTTAAGHNFSLLELMMSMQQQKNNKDAVKENNRLKALERTGLFAPGFVRKQASVGVMTPDRQPRTLTKDASWAKPLLRSAVRIGKGLTGVGLQTGSVPAALYYDYQRNKDNYIPDSAGNFVKRLGLGVANALAGRKFAKNLAGSLRVSSGKLSKTFNNFANGNYRFANNVWPNKLRKAVAGSGLMYGATFAMPAVTDKGIEIATQYGPGIAVDIIRRHPEATSWIADTIGEAAKLGISNSIKGIGAVSHLIPESAVPNYTTKEKLQWIGSKLQNQQENQYNYRQYIPGVLSATPISVEGPK